MELTSLFNISPIILHAVTTPAQDVDLVIDLQAGSPTTMPGRPSKQAGDIILSKTIDTKLTAVVSLGIKEKAVVDTFRSVGGNLARWLLKSGASSAFLSLDMCDEWASDQGSNAFLEGLLLGSFQFKQYKSEAGDEKSIHVYVTQSQPGLDAIVAHATSVASAVNLARGWAHEPANTINPVTLAERVLEMARHDQLVCRVLDEGQLSEMGAGGILNVGRGSASQPRLITLEYPGKPTTTDVRPVVLIGKAITFDTGGYSLKSVENIQGMKYDKSGGVTVAAILHLAAQLKLQTPLVGIIAAAENLISDHAYRPDDIIRMLSGTTVEIISTDAEGRLVLADALTYSQKNYAPRAIIDMATLTGGVVTALGRARAGLMSNHDALSNQLIRAGEATHERLWRLPLDDDYAKLIEGDDADIKNSGGREAHAIIGGIFLKHFVEDKVPWAHIDIAGVATSPKDLAYCPKGATGFGVRLITNYLENLDESDS